jgi:hypothetical protein
MAESKTPVEITAPDVKKAFDPKLGKKAADALAASIKGFVDKGDFKVVNAAPKKEKGFVLIPRITELAMDEKKAGLSIKAEVEVNTLPGPNLARNVKGSSGFEGANMKKLDKEVEDLVAEMMKKTGPALVKTLEDKLAEM